MRTTLMMTPTPARLVAMGGLALAISLTAASVTHAGEEVLRFNRDIRPVLAETCFRCHGPGVKKAGLRLDQRDAALKASESGEIPIVPGKIEESEIIRRILSDDESEVMPPPSAKKPLTPEQKNLLKRWVEQGAPYEPHWSYTTPVKDPIPHLEKPASSTANPIDAFIAGRLQREGLTMSPEADKETLIRRVAFALTGLPPTPREVDAFLGDSSAKSYENMVERYLFSPRYGEEMARHWLDVARYADTHGLHLDNERQMWPYRDWVIKSFNDNQPFDRFTVEQLAGDLLPTPTTDQLVATGFNRCGVTTSEGGSIEAEWYFRNAVERASTMAETWMGMTAGCAVCHDHKFDPLSAQEFYSLYAFFYSAAGPAMDGNALLHEPTLKLPTPSQKEKLAALDAQLAEVRKELDKTRRSLAYRDPAEDAKPAGTEQAGSQPSAAGVDPRANDPSQSFRAWSKPKGTTEAKAAPAAIQALLKKAQAGGSLPAAEETSLRSYYLENVCEATKGAFQPLLEKDASLSKARTELDGQIVATYIFKDSDKPRDAFVMLRGQYDRPGTKVEPGTPAVLPPLSRGGANARATRLDLANWLVAPEHPLTARVTVNRFWQQMFGTGLVKTAFDFGTQGEPPSHPELLDWLSVSFRESGWDVKALLRLMVNSATFRQSSRTTPELQKRDPENRLYAHGPRFRLDAEQIRDNALFVSGLINLGMGGRGVKPYQPPNIWEPVAYTGSNTRSYKPDEGPAVYRRSLYTFMKRTAPPPFLTNFDAPNREAFCTRRERSNTPLQALQLLNDVQHFEAARALAEQMIGDGGATPSERIGHGFRMVLARKAEPDELATLLDQYGKHLARFVREPEAAKQVVRVGNSPPKAGLPEAELAAYALVANTLLNLDETVTRN